MCAHRLSTDLAGDSARKLNSLSRADMQVATFALRAFAPDWSVDQHDDCSNDIMLMLTPPGPEETSPTFVLSNTADGIQLAVVLGDSCDTLGTFQHVRNVIHHVQQVMATVSAHAVVSI